MRVGRFVFFFSVLGVAGSAFAGHLLDGNPVSPSYNNPSFETPDVAPGPTSVSLSAPPWTLSGPNVIFNIPPFGPVPLIPGAGVFENPATVGEGRIEGAGGTQLAYIFANSYADALDAQVKDHAFTQILPLVFEEGNRYLFGMGVASAQSAPPADSVMSLSLFAYDPGTMGEELLASETLTVADVNGLSLTDFHVWTDPIAGSAIGKQIGMRISTHTAPKTPAATGQFDFDNVYLVVPEPGSMAMLGGVALIAIARRRRR